MSLSYQLQIIAFFFVHNYFYYQNFEIQWQLKIVTNINSYCEIIQYKSILEQTLNFSRFQLHSILNKLQYGNSLNKINSQLDEKETSG